MDWLQITQALFLAAILVFLFPAAKNAFKNREQSFSGNWGAIIPPLLMVIIIVAVLVSFVR